MRFGISNTMGKQFKETLQHVHESVASLTLNKVVLVILHLLIQQKLNVQWLCLLTQISQCRNSNRASLPFPSTLKRVPYSLEEHLENAFKGFQNLCLVVVRSNFDRGLVTPFVNPQFIQPPELSWILLCLDK